MKAGYLFLAPAASLQGHLRLALSLDTVLTYSKRPSVCVSPSSCRNCSPTHPTILRGCGVTAGTPPSHTQVTALSTVGTLRPPPLWMKPHQMALCWGPLFFPIGAPANIDTNSLSIFSWPFSSVCGKRQITYAMEQKKMIPSEEEKKTRQKACKNLWNASLCLPFKLPLYFWVQLVKN